MFIDLDDYVTSYGKFGKCSECESACESTALIGRKRFCEDCKDQLHPKRAVEFQETDATFKCRAGSCGADKLSYRELVIGVCCQAALTKKPLSEEAKREHQVITKIYTQTEKENRSFDEKIVKARNETYAAKLKLRKTEEALKKAKESFREAQMKFGFVYREQSYSDSLLKTCEKRVLIVTKAAFENDDEPEAKKAKQDDVDEKHECRLCFHPYDDDRSAAVIIPCAHMFCFDCISSLPQKKCPNCRAEFTDSNVYKIH